MHSLSVPGLAEKRPSVLVGEPRNTTILKAILAYDPSGDVILVQERGATSRQWFEGHVHFVRQSEVGLVFHKKFSPSVQGRLFHVRFKLNRIPVRRQHEAMDTVFNEEHILFPVERHLVNRPARVALKLFNTSLSTNAPQLQAVASILKSPRGSPPFVIFGP